MEGGLISLYDCMWNLKSCLNPFVLSGYGHTYVLHNAAQLSDELRIIFDRGVYFFACTTV